MTLRKFARSIKPGVPRSVHLFSAPFLWSVIGCMLLTRGFFWLHTGTRFWFFLLALLVGTMKSLFILDKVALKSIDRIAHFQDGTCIGALYSWKSWLMVAMMMGAGVCIRRLGHPGQWVGTLYCAVGWALCFSSRLGWNQWFTLRKVHEH
nr:hypothetical protein [uncultured Desulfobulbus sp.]